MLYLVNKNGEIIEELGVGDVALLQDFLDGKANLSSGNNFEGNQLINGILRIDNTFDGCIEIQEDGARRWLIGKASTESGSNNSGSDYTIYRYDDNGGYLSAPFKIMRTSGETRITQLRAYGEAKYNDVSLMGNDPTDFTHKNYIDTGLYFSLGGRFLLDPNEFNGWGVNGIYDDLITTDLGNVGAEASYLSGGLCFPFDIQLKQFYAWNRQSNAGALPWGWRINAQTKVDDSSAKTNVEILRECVGVGATAIGPRNYGDNVNHLTDIDLSSSPVIPAGTIITLGVEAPTAVGTNYYIDIMGGYLLYDRVS